MIGQNLFTKEHYMIPENRIARLYKMALYISRNPGCSADNLALEFNVSKRQIFRDKHDLESAGFPIYYDNGYRMLKWGPIMKSIVFTAEEALALIYSIKLLEQQKEVFLAPQLLYQKLLSILPDKFKEVLKDTSQKIDVVVSPSADYSGKNAFFKIVNEGIQRKVFLNAKYYSFSRDKLSERLIAPQHLVFQDGFWYIVAFCKRNNETRLFRLDRVHGLELTEEKSDFIEDISYDDYIGDAWFMGRGDEFVFRAKFFGESARFIKETHFHPSQKIYEESFDCIIFEAKACNLASIHRWLMPFAKDLEVVEPPALKQMVIDSLEQGLRRYKKYK